MDFKYDVFISYSRKDTAVADEITRAFEKEGISYFIDRKGIRGGMEFPMVLAKAIRESKVFLFLASENSYVSKFAQNEIVYAFNKKEKQDIIPYIIDGSQLPEELEFTFSAINWRVIEQHPIETMLIDDILYRLGRERKKTGSLKAVEKSNIEVKESPIVVEEHPVYEKTPTTTVNEQPVYYNEGNNGVNNKLLYIIIASLLAILAIGGYFFFDKNQQQETDAQHNLVTDSIVSDSITRAEEDRQTNLVAPKDPTAPPQFYGQVNDPDGYTNIRRGPGTNYHIVANYNSGDYLYFTPQSNGWSMVYTGVKANTFIGYMHTSRIKKINTKHKR